MATSGVAQASGGYGYNHAHIQWNTLETEHFLFHWPESTLPETDPHYFTTEFSVGQLARVAEESYPKITGQFGVDLKEKVHVVVYDQDAGWEGNGFAIAEWDWTGFAANWGPIFRERGRMEFLSDVFVHEFAHIVSLKAYLPWAEDTTGFQVGGLVEDEEWLRRWGLNPRPNTNADLAFDMVLTAHTPFWWAEGGAEYWSHQAGYNFWGSSRDAFLRVSVLEGRVLSAAEWETRNDKEGMEGERGYNHGYAFGLWLAQRFPDRDVFTEMARISAQKWHTSWDAVVEEATGVPMDTLYLEWRAHLDAHYGAQADAIRAAGVVAGREMSLVEPPYERNDAEWQALPWKRQKEALDGDNAWIELPRSSPDGRWMAWFDGGLVLRQISAPEWGAIGGAYVGEKDKKALKSWDERTIYDGWVHGVRVDFSPDSKRLVGVMGEDHAPAWAKDAGLTFNADGYSWPELVVGTIDEGDGYVDVKWAAVPGTLRATEAAFAPDGETLAFSRYGDGTHELWTVKTDGSELVERTDFRNGTQIAGIDFSADGKKVLLGLYQNYRQDLWLLELETGAWERLTDSRGDEVDPSFGPDGRVYFASDEDGVFDVYALDLDTRVVTRQTRVLGSAYGATVSPEGHLFYTGFTGHGYRNFAVKAEDRLEEVVAYDACPCAPDEELAFRPSAPVDVRAASRPYTAAGGQLPLTAWPSVQVSDKNLLFGADLFLGDVVEEHWLETGFAFGKDKLFSAVYYNEMFWPSLSLGYMRYDYKGTYSYQDDLDGLVETDHDRSTVDVKFEQASDDVWAYASYYPSDALWVGAGADASRYSFRDTGDGNRWVPFVVNSGVGLWAEWTPRPAWYDGDDWINPRGGRRLYADYGLRHTSVLDPETAGAVYDDGELMDRYWFNRFSASWTEYVPVPFTRRHTLQLDFEIGYIDRNVMGWDEFIAGGRHPYDWGSGTLGNNVQFSGYEGWSLSGETMVIANASYRFPLARDMNLKLGPTYTESVYLQLMGTVGNLWSYRVEGPSHVEGYSVVPDAEGSVRRELPFRDYASKNSPEGQPHYLLSDVGAEIRVQSTIWNDYEWDSFLRFSYGFQETAGYGDVNADLIQSAVARDSRSELSSETEPPSLRVYLGVGTGW